MEKVTKDTASSNAPIYPALSPGVPLLSPEEGMRLLAEATPTGGNLTGLGARIIARKNAQRVGGSTDSKTYIIPLRYRMPEFWLECSIIAMQVGIALFYVACGLGVVGALIWILRRALS